MSAEADARSPTDWDLARVREIVLSFDRFKTAVWFIAALQALWLGALMAHGWYYQADLANLAEATGRSLSWSYLVAPQGGHFGLPVRVIFWVLNRLAPLNYPVTIGLRLVGQSLATVLLARLLVLLVGRRPIVLVTTSLYAFSPFLIQGTLWLSASLGLIGSELMLLGALTSHVRYAISRRLFWAVATAGYALGATLLSEQAAVTVLVLPILSLCFLASGSARQRLGETLSCWREWLLIAAVMVGYLFYYFSGGDYGGAAHPLGVSQAARVIRVELSNTIAPGLVGGPWRWFSAGDNYLGLSTPSSTTQALCAAAVVVVIALCFRAQGWRALAAWSLPALTAAVGIVIVAVGRYDTFGVVIAQQFEHAYFSALPAVIAVCVGFCGIDLDGVRARSNRVFAEVPASGGLRRSCSRPRRMAITSAVAVVLVSSVVSGVTYTRLWARNPARSYVATLEQSLRTAGPAVALYDTPVPSRIIPLESIHYVSDVVGLTNSRADFGYSARRPSLINGNGEIAPARFFVQTDVDLTGSQFCRFPVQGSAIVTKQFRASQRRSDWYLQISYFEQHASVLKVALIDSDGAERLPVSGSREVLHSGPGGMHLLFRASSPAAVRVEGTSSATNVCITAAQIGFPFAAKKDGS